MKKLVSYLPLVLLLFIASCTGDRISVLSFSPEGEVEEFTTFQMELSEAVAPESAIGEWSDESYMEFEPAASGKFKWISPSTLIFSPDKPLEPGKDYTAKLTKKALFGSSKSADFTTFEFHTPYFDAVKADFFWNQIPRSDFKVTVQANLHFNYPVDPSKIKEFLTVEKEGQAVTSFTVVSEEPSEVIALDFGQQQQTEKQQDFKITVKAGLTSTVSDRAMTDNREYDVAMDPLSRLAITSASSGYDGQKGWIEVFTTQAVDEKVLQKYLTLSPRKTFKVTSSANSFRLEGDFQPGSVVEMVVKKGLPGLYGGQLDDEYSQEVLMADLQPRLSFADEKGQYLMRGGEENVKLNAVNVRRANVRIYEVFANNLLFYMYNRGSGYYYDNCCGVQNGFVSYGEGEGDYYEDDYYYDDYYSSRADVGNYGRLLHEDSVILGDQKNRLNEFTVNLSDHLDDRFRGIYVVEVRDDRDYWRRDVKIVSVSDLGIITKRSKDELLVFVNSIQSAQPVEGAEVRLISTNNQSLLTGTSDAQGIVHFKNVAEEAKDFVPRLVTARKGDDFNFIDFKSTEVGLSRFEVGGKQEYSDTYETFIYPDRNLFRPGEKAHFNTIVRDKDFGNVTDIPVILKVIDPRGRVFQESKKTLNSEGSTELEVDIPTYASTGDYTLEAYSGSDELMASYGFSVEEFVPDKIRVEAESKDETVDLGEELSVDIFSEYLFGAPCSNHSYEVDVNLRHAPFYSKKYKKYRFSPEDVDNEYLENEFDSGELDETGRATFTWKAAEEYSAAGIIKGTAYTTVFDATGRTVTRPFSFKLNPNDYFIGIERGNWYVSTNEPVNVKAIAIDPGEKVLNSFRAEVEVIRYEWRTVLKKNRRGEYHYQSERKEIQEDKRSLTLNGPTQYAFTPRSSGRYEVRIRKQGEERYTARSIYAYGRSSSTATSFEVDREGRIEIVPDKDKYAPGESAKLLFKTPFSGRMLVTIERDRVLDYQMVDVVNNSAELEIPLNDDHLPNAFVSATLFKGHEAESPTPFLVGHGYQPLMVEAQDNRIPVEIEAPERIKPRRNQEIVIKTVPQKDVHVTLAMVDEGILQIKNFKTPDPYAFMYAKRKLSVSSYDLYEYLMDEVMSLNSSAAGGDEFGAGKRINPITAKRFKLLSFWSGVKKSDANGEVRVTVPVPQFNGSARLMAVAYTGRRFGSTSKSMTITDDVVLFPAAPRFLSPNDSLSLPISLMNTTTNAGKVKVTVKTEGPLKLTGPASQSVSMKAKDNQNVKFGLKVDNSVGVGKILISTTGLDQVTDEIELAIRPTSPLVVEDGFGTIQAGKNSSVSLPGGYISSSQNTTLSISKFPAVKFAGNLSYLVKYPHGCVEQTTSKLFPQLYFDDLAAAIAPDVYVNGNPVYFIKEGIRKLQSMQLGDGSLAYWPGGSYTSWWGSVYAAHFLVEAKKAGYDVRDNVLDRLLSYLGREAADKDTYSYRHYRSGSLTTETKARKETLYSLYVLALAGKSDLALMNYYRARPHLLTTDSRYLLAGAFGLSNKWNAFNELMPGTFLSEEPLRESGGSFDSPVRANAIVLSVLCDVDPKNKQIPSLIRYLTAKGRRIYSTQDKAWSFLALGKAVSKNAKAKVNVDVLVDGKNIGNYNNQNWSLSSKQLNGKNVSFKPTGSGEVYYFWSTEGIKMNGADVPDEDENIQVRRRYYNRDGELLTGGAMRQGDLIVCEIELRTGLRGVENLVVSDLIPAGLEIENPRLGTSTSLSWIKSNLYPDYMDVRDDRMLLFTNMSANDNRKYHYMMRAVTAGKFKLAPVGCEAMYDPDFHSYNGGGWVSVVPK